jgi:hypothetical protein
VCGEHELRLRRKRVGELEVDRGAASREVDQRRVGEAHVDPPGKRGDGWIGAFDQTVVTDGLDLLEVIGVRDRAASEVADRAARALDRALELADAAEGQAGRRAALGGAEPSLALRNGVDRSRCGTRPRELQRDRVELDASVQKERRHLRHADLDSIAGQIVAARGELVIPAAIEVVGRVGIAEQAGQPQAQIARVDRHHDVALVVDHVLKRRQRIAPLTQHRVVDQALLAAEVAAVEGYADVVAGRRLAIGGLALHEQMRARTIGSRHACLLRSVGFNCWARDRCC